MQHPILTIAVRAARIAGNMIAKQYEKPISIEINQKKSNNLIAGVNKTVETVIIETIRKFYPHHTILIKEDSENISINQDVQWVVNPLDGIFNFVKKLPHFSVAIAIRIKGRTRIAVIYDPIRNELFTAASGQGAQLNGYRLRGSTARNLDETILAIGFPLKVRQYTSTYMNILNKLSTKCAGFRIIGSDALDLAYVAAGRVDGYFKMSLRPWDFSAGELIVQEAGALICDFTGGNNYTMTGNLIAGNSRIVRSILVNIRDELRNI